MVMPGAAPGEIADNNTGAAKDERKLLTGRKTDDHGKEQYAKQDRAELCCAHAGLRDKIGQAFPSCSVASLRIIRAGNGFTDAAHALEHLGMPCSASSVMPTNSASLTGHAGGAHTE